MSSHQIIFLGWVLFMSLVTRFVTASTGRIWAGSGPVICPIARKTAMIPYQPGTQ